MEAKFRRIKEALEGFGDPDNYTDEKIFAVMAKVKDADGAIKSQGIMELKLYLGERNREVRGLYKEGVRLLLAGQVLASHTNFTLAGNLGDLVEKLEAAVEDVL